MRVVATALVGLAAALAAAAVYFQQHYPWLAWVRAGAEAALVGGLADWFAVTALFHRPLGLPFPHSAIIPRNKDRIGAELGQFIERNLLTPDHIRTRLATVDFAGQAARWAAREENAKALAGLAQSVLPRLLDALDESGIEALFARIARDRLDRLDPSLIAGRALRFLAADGRLQPFLNELLDALARWLDRNRGTLKDRSKARSRWLPGWADAFIVNKFVDAVIDLLEEVAAAPRHELRQSFDALAAEFAQRLETDPAWRAEALRLKHEIVEQVGIDRLTASLWHELKRRLDGSDAPVEARLGEAIRRLAADLPADGDIARRLNKAVLALLGGLADRFHRQVSALVVDVVARWDARELSARLEREVGSDLQYIRINGTLVGAAVGLALYGLTLLAGY